MRVVIVLLVWLATTALVVPAMFFAGMILAGPHSSVLPEWLQPGALLLCWVLVVLVPAFVARAIWLRLSRGQRGVSGC